MSMILRLNTVIKDESCDAVLLENLLKYLPKLQKLKIECVNSESLIERNRCKLNINCAQNFTLKDFKALISGPLIKSVILNDTIIKYENGVAVPVTDLLEYLPNLEDFKIDDQGC
uniref:Uncharacterized protein n=1 Tax=Panagrolaimus sp. PS1159 TaxID=55785 RepID=A0AC35G2B4_9BILA